MPNDSPEGHEGPQESEIKGPGDDPMKPAKTGVIAELAKHPLVATIITGIFVVAAAVAGAAYGSATAPDASVVAMSRISALETELRLQKGMFDQAMMERAELEGRKRLLEAEKRAVQGDVTRLQAELKMHEMVVSTFEMVPSQTVPLYGDTYFTLDNLKGGIPTFTTGLDDGSKKTIALALSEGINVRVGVLFCQYQLTSINAPKSVSVVTKCPPKYHNELSDKIYYGR
ncbi:hypothetical protein PMI07_001491 [Rhizobium sp. CF080]|uniref:hypothetical protein n=1 Tax=Rhizobium sp. (strain CF080) TaxID=1144310 RepID=UPI0002715EE3|nr:hypothetical protein [Rhizobium sp. CF080]EUB96592.1 hypothetical protein PMI07_001491 [Rhizobium sp. CF080]